jgi:hypothetical protein
MAMKRYQTKFIDVARASGIKQQSIVPQNKMNFQLLPLSANMVVLLHSST